MSEEGAEVRGQGPGAEAEVVPPPLRIFDTLSEEEREVARLLAGGYIHKEIARRWDCGVRTIERIRHNLRVAYNAPGPVALGLYLAQDLAGLELDMPEDLEPTDFVRADGRGDRGQGPGGREHVSEETA